MQIKSFREGITESLIHLPFSCLHEYWDKQTVACFLLGTHDKTYCRRDYMVSWVAGWPHDFGVFGWAVEWCKCHFEKVKVMDDIHNISEAATGICDIVMTLCDYNIDWLK